MIRQVLSGEPLSNAFGSHLPRSAINKRESKLTPQQQRVLHLICKGFRNKKIAQDLNVSEITVKAHVTSIFQKLSVSSRTEAALMAQQMRVTRVPGDISKIVRSPDNEDDNSAN